MLVSTFILFPMSFLTLPIASKKEQQKNAKKVSSKGRIYNFLLIFQKKNSKKNSISRLYQLAENGKYFFKRK